MLPENVDGECSTIPDPLRFAYVSFCRSQRCILSRLQAVCASSVPARDSEDTSWAGQLLLDQTDMSNNMHLSLNVPLASSV